MSERLAQLALTRDQAAALCGLTASGFDVWVRKGVVPGKYDEVLQPFLAMMERELHANSGKGDRPGWLAMPRQDVLLEIYYHLAKLQKAVRKDDADGIGEFAADVANMSMMLVDVCSAWPAARQIGEAMEGK